MKKVYFLAALTVSIFAYDINPTVETGEWIVDQATEKELTVTIVGDTQASFEDFQLEEGETLCIRGSDKLTLSLAQISGTIISDVPLHILGENFELESGAEIIAPDVHFKTQYPPRMHGTVDAKTINLCFPQGGHLDLSGSKLIGEKFIDPKNIVIQLGGTDPATGNTFASNPSGDVTISGADLATAIDAGSVTLQANTDITIDDDVTATTASNGLTLQAGRSIIINPSRTITLNAGAFSATVNDGGAQSGDRDAGSPIFSMAPNSAINTAGGAITIDAGTFAPALSGQLQLITATLDAAGGNIALTGVATDHTVPHGIVLSETTMTTDSTGTLSLTGTGGSTVSMSCGLDINTPIFSVEDGTLTLTGTGGGIVATGKTYNYGIRVLNGTIDSTGSGNIDITATGGLGETRNFGMMFTGSAQVTASTGIITLDGTGGGTLDQNYGVRFEGSAIMSTTSTGNINIIGLGGGAGDTNIGVIVSGDSNISVVDGTLDFDATGAGSGNGNHGFVLESSATIVSTGTGPIQITGESSATGAGNNFGVDIASFLPITAGEAAITITGTSHGSGDFNQGVRIERSASVTSTGSSTPGDITITGTGGSGTKANHGVDLERLSSITADAANIVVSGTPDIFSNNATVSSTSGTVTPSSLENP